MQIITDFHLLFYCHILFKPRYIKFQFYIRLGICYKYILKNGRINFFYVCLTLLYLCSKAVEGNKNGILLYFFCRKKISVFNVKYLFCSQKQRIILHVVL